jgi:hypothetical protein
VLCINVSIIGLALVPDIFISTFHNRNSNICGRFCSWFLTHSMFSDFSDRRKFCFARDPAREGQGLLHAAVQAEQAGHLLAFRVIGKGVKNFKKTKLYFIQTDPS